MPASVVNRRLSSLRARLEPTLAATVTTTRAARAHTGPLLERMWRRARPVLDVVRPLGWTVAVVAVVGWLVGSTLGWVEAMTLASVAAALLVLAALFLVGRSALAVAVEVRPPRVTVGERAVGQLTATNAASTRLLPIRVDLVVGIAVAGFDISSLAPGDHQEELFQVGTERRGVIRVGPARVVRADPLGLFARVVSQSTAVDLYVHPRTVRVPGAGIGFLRDIEGGESADLSPSDLAFHSLREYVPGDDRRHVHWKTSARSGRLMVQQFVDTRRSHVLLVLDDEAVRYGGADDFEVAVSVVASIGVRAIADDQVRSVVVGGRFLPARSRGALLDALSEVGADGPIGSMERSAAVAARSTSEPSIVILVTGGTATVPELRTMARRFSIDARVAAVRVGSPEARIQMIENMLVLDLLDLADLPRVVNVAVRA